MTLTARTRHVPLRRCVLCRASQARGDLIRLVQFDDGYRSDPARKLGGRGTWVCRSCAADPNEKRLRQAFAGQAHAVRALLAGAVSTPTSPAAQGVAGNPASEA